MLAITLPLQMDVLVITYHQLKEKLARIVHQPKAEWIILLLLQHPLSLWQR